MNIFSSVTILSNPTFFQEIPEDPPEESAQGGALPRAGGRPNLAAMQCNREAKIKRYKEAKELKQKLSALGDWNVIANREEDMQVRIIVWLGFLKLCGSKSYAPCK